MLEDRERGVLEGQGLCLPWDTHMSQEPRSDRTSKGGVGSGARLACPKVGGKREDHPKGSKTLADGGGQWRACWDLEQDLGCRIDSGKAHVQGKVGSRGRGQVGGATGAWSQAGACAHPRPAGSLCSWRSGFPTRRWCQCLCGS